MAKKGLEALPGLQMLYCVEGGMIRRLIITYYERYGLVEDSLLYIKKKNSVLACRSNTFFGAFEDFSNSI